MVGALAACGSSDPATPSSATGTSSAAASSAAPSSAAASSPATPTGGGGPAGTPTLATPSTATGTPTTLTGTIEAGVESGCLVLTGPDGAVLANLIGLDAATAPTGVQVEVSGKFATDMMTTCQQGDPFAVAEVVQK